MKIIKCLKIRFLLGAAFLGTFSGCVGYVDGPHQQAYVQAGVQDDYVYYPDYQVYYSSNSRQYVYKEGSSWVTRSAPKGISRDALSASPSVKLDFHDHPSFHHDAVVKQYPQHGNSSVQANKEGGKDRN